MQLFEQLIREYVAFKAAFKAGKRELFSMTDREGAGMWLKVASPGRALEAFDSSPMGAAVRGDAWGAHKIVKVDRDKERRTRELIERAEQEARD